MSGKELIVRNLKSIKGRIEELAKARKVTLVAVSKTKPSSDIQICYDEGHRDFGENYVQELLEKSQQLPADINWHFIGALQFNKIKLLAQIPNLYAIHSIESQKHADAVNKAFSGRNPPLNIFVQVNTSQEQSKHGSDRQSALDLAKHIINNCPNVKFIGFMTIGAPDRSESERPNPDFVSMQECRDALLKNFNGVDCFLSMGMSSDYEHAIEMGTSFVRVGSSIFGARNYSKWGQIGVQMEKDSGK